MGSIYHPTVVGEDDMANNWGTSFVPDVVQKRCAGSKAEVTSLIRLLCPLFRLLMLTDSGTSANDRAIDLCTKGDHGACLFAMGSYVAGSGISQAYSTTKLMPNNVISLVSNPVESSDQAKTNTIAFPYHCPHGQLDDDLVKELERKCLHVLKIKLVTAVISGRPFRALLFEFILSGSGGILTNRFLLALARLLGRFKIAIIADEIMTGGRVGPEMTMTSTLPKEVQVLVEYITMGKSMGCGMVLDRVDSVKNDRGTSTEMSYAAVYAPLKAIHERAQSGYIQAKRAKVLSAMRVNEGDINVWPDNGGLLIFFNKLRGSVSRGLKCRALPTLEMGQKTRLHITGRASEYDRVTVNLHLMESCNAWLDHTMQLSSEIGSPYSFELARFLVSSPNKSDIGHGQLMAFIKEHGCQADEDSLVRLHRTRRLEVFGKYTGRCQKSHKNLVWDSLKHAAAYSNGFLTPVKVNHKRQLFYRMDYDQIC